MNPTKTVNDEYLPKITVENVRQALRSYLNSAAGIDRISGKMLRHLAPVIALPLYIIFQQSLTTGVFPAAWKTAIITPIYKAKGDKELASSNRPFCSILSKVLERLIKNLIWEAAICIKPIHNAQHGFCHQRSTLTNLLITDRIINEVLKDKASIDIIIIDFARAFDKVPHDLLLQRRMIPVQLLHWMRSYLGSRKQCVRLAGVLSFPQSVTSGTIQGSCLAPTCFTLFVDELFQALSAEILHSPTMLNLWLTFANFHLTLFKKV